MRTTADSESHTALPYPQCHRVIHTQPELTVYSSGCSEGGGGGGGSKTSLCKYPDWITLGSCQIAG